MLKFQARVLYAFKGKMEMIEICKKKCVTSEVQRSRCFRFEECRPLGHDHMSNRSSVHSDHAVPPSLAFPTPTLWCCIKTFSNTGTNMAQTQSLLLLLVVALLAPLSHASRAAVSDHSIEVHHKNILPGRVQTVQPGAAAVTKYHNEKPLIGILTQPCHSCPVE